MKMTQAPVAPLWRRWSPTLVTLVILVSVYQPNWVVESLDLRTTGHLTFAVVNPVDLVLIPFALMTVFALRRALRGRPPSLPLWIGVLLMVGGLVSLAVHPSLRGCLITFRLSAGLGIIWAIAQFGKEEFVRNLALPALAVAGLQGGLAIAQLMTDSALLPEWSGAIAPVTTDGVARAAGTFGHAYEASTFALVAVALGIAAYRTVPRWRVWWLIAIGFAAVPAAISFSRAALVAVLAIVGVLLWGILREIGNWRPVLVALALGTIIPAGLFAGSWTSRADQSVAGVEGSGVNVRTEQLEQAWSLIESDWLIGVGPGLYSVTLESRMDIDPLRAYPVHNVPLYVAAEDGAIVGGLLVLMGVALAFYALRRSTENRALFLAPIPVLIFDVLLYTAPTGLLMLSLWLGGLAALESRPEL